MAIWCIFSDLVFLHVLAVWPFIFYGLRKGCQMVYFLTKNSNFGHLVYFIDIWYMYFIDIWYILLTFGIFYGRLEYVLEGCTKKNLASLV
jgi:hypothetical protein